MIEWRNQMRWCLKRSHRPVVVVNFRYRTFVVCTNYGPRLGKFHLKTLYVLYRIWLFWGWICSIILTPFTLIWNWTGVAARIWKAAASFSLSHFAARNPSAKKDIPPGSPPTPFKSVDFSKKKKKFSFGFLHFDVVRLLSSSEEAAFPDSFHDSSYLQEIIFHQVFKEVQSIRDLYLPVWWWRCAPVNAKCSGSGSATTSNVTPIF